VAWAITGRRYSTKAPTPTQGSEPFVPSPGWNPNLSLQDCPIILRDGPGTSAGRSSEKRIAARLSPTPSASCAIRAEDPRGELSAAFFREQGIGMNEGVLGKLLAGQRPSLSADQRAQAVADAVRTLRDNQPEPTRAAVRDHLKERDIGFANTALAKLVAQHKRTEQRPSVSADQQARAVADAVRTFRDKKETAAPESSDIAVHPTARPGHGARPPKRRRLTTPSATRNTRPSPTPSASCATSNKNRRGGLSARTSKNGRIRIDNAVLAELLAPHRPTRREVPSSSREQQAEAVADAGRTLRKRNTWPTR
jgi:hypothetical protein